MIDQKIEAYDRSSSYNLDNEILLKSYAEMVVEKINHPTKVAVLDLGLGYGYATERFLNYFVDYTILEGDKKIIDMFDSGHPNCTAQIINTYFETFETEKKYDVVIMGFVLEHVEDPVSIMSKYKGMLNENGKIYAAVPNSHSLNRRVGYYAGILDDMKRMSDYDIGLGHKRYYDIDSFKSDCLAAGLKINKVEGIYLKAITTAQIKTLNFSDNILEAFCKVGRDYPELCVGMLADLEVE